MEKKSKYSKIQYSRERTIFISHYTIYTYVEHLPLNPFFFHNIKVIVFAKDESPLVIVIDYRYTPAIKTVECVFLLWWCYQKFVASSIPRPSLFYLRSKNYILMAVSHSFKIFQRTTRKCIFHTLCDITFTVEISEKKNLPPRQVHLFFHVNKRANPTLSFVGKRRK